MSRARSDTPRRAPPMSPPPEPTVRRELFGGAVSCDFPTRWIDVSDFRPVPDNQEVWTDADRDESVIFEVLERVEVGPSDADGAAVWFFDDLATINDASVASGLSAVETTRHLTAHELPSINGVFACASLCVGTSQISKGNDGVDKRNAVRVAMANVRLPEFGTDLLVTLNRAITIAKGSSADAPRAGDGDDEVGAGDFILRVLQSLRIEDWGLFG